jgi:hypothetical protein
MHNCDRGLFGNDGLCRGDDIGCPPANFDLFDVKLPPRSGATAAESETCAKRFGISTHWLEACVHKALQRC